MAFKIRGDRQVGHCLSASRLAEIRSSAESLLLSHEKSGAAAVADALIKASEAMSYNVRAQFAVDLSKACISKGNRSLFEGVLGVLLSQNPLSADEALDDLDFALDAADDDDTFVDVKTGNASNMHSRHTHHHLGLTMASLSLSAKDWCLQALRDSNTLMYPKAASLLCSLQRKAPVTPDAELIAFASDPCCKPRLVRIIMAACMRHKRIAVCDALAAHFWSCHHRDRCALLLPSCSASFLRNFLRDVPQVVTETDFNIDRFLKEHADVSLDLLEAKLKKSAPSRRPSIWAHGPFRFPHEWVHPLLERNPAAHIRLASLASSYPSAAFVRTSGGFSEDGKPIAGFSSVLPTFPFNEFETCIMKCCKVKGHASDFWKVWFPIALDTVTTQCQPVLCELSVLSAFDAEENRETATKIILSRLPLEDQQNEVLVSCILRSHTITEVNSFHQLDDREFDDMVTSAKEICAHPKLSRSIYQNYASIVDLPLSQDQFCAVLEKIISVANHTEALSSNHSMDMIANLRLSEAYGRVVSHAGLSLNGASKPLAVFTALHRFSLISLARLSNSDAMKPSAPLQSFEAITSLWSEASQHLLSCLIERALIHGDSSFTIDGIVISNATFLSQQLQTWLSLLHDEFGSQFIAAATATCRFQPSLKWNQELIENQLSSLKNKIISSLIGIDWGSTYYLTAKTFGFSVWSYGANASVNTIREHQPHPSVLQVLVNFVLDHATASVKSTASPFVATNLVSYFPNFDIVSSLAVKCFVSQGVCIDSPDIEAKFLFESLDSLIAQLGQYAAKRLLATFPIEKEYFDAAATFIQACSRKCNNFFSLVSFLRPILEQLSRFFQSRNSNPLQFSAPASSSETAIDAQAPAKLSEASLSTILRTICNIFQRGLGCFVVGSNKDQEQFRALRFSSFFGVSIEQHLIHALEFLFHGCKTCALLSSSSGLLYQLSIDIFSTLCFRLNPSDALFGPVIEFVKESLQSFSLIRQELVMCDNLPGDVMNEIAWDFASNPKLPESVRERALSYLDLSDPSKKQEILQTKCRARTFELRLLGFQILLKASIQLSHPQWASNFISAVHDIYSKTANESLENLNSIYGLLSTNLSALQMSLDEVYHSSRQFFMMSHENSAEFQAIFSKIVCNITSTEGNSEDDDSDCSDMGSSSQSRNLHTLRQALVKFALFSADVVMHVCPEEESRLPLQNWISFAMGVKFSQEAQDNSDDLPCEIARSFVLQFKLRLAKPVADPFAPRDDQLRKHEVMMQHYVSCIIKAYDDLGSRYPNPDSDTVHVASQRDVTCLSMQRLNSLMELCTPNIWMQTDIVACLLAHFHGFDLKTVRRGCELPDDVTFFYSCVLKQWIKSSSFKNAHNPDFSRAKSNAAVSSARFTPIRELDCLTSDLHSLTQMFLDTFIRSDHASSILLQWLAYYSMGTIVFNLSMSRLFRRPVAQPHVENLLRLCPSSAYIPFVNRFMVRFAQHLIPSQFLHEPPLGKESFIEGIFLPTVSKSKPSTKTRNAKARDDKRTAAPTTILSVWMYSWRLHANQTARLKNQLLKTFCDASIGSTQRLKALRRATRLPSLTNYDVLKVVQPEFVAPPLQVAVIGGFVSASLDFEDSSNISVTTLWKSNDSMALYPESVDLYMAGPERTLLSSGSYKCFVPVAVSIDPTLSSLMFAVDAVAVDSIDAFVETHILSGILSDVDLCAGIERTFDPSQSKYELCIAWTMKSLRALDARSLAIQALHDQLAQEFSIQCSPARQKRHLHLQSTTSSKSKPAVFRKITFVMKDNTEKLVRQCFDDSPVNLFPRLSAEISRAAIVACGYCSESTACIDTVYSPRFLASSLSSAAVMLFERSSSIFPSGSAVKFAEKLLFRDNVFFPPKVTIQKAIVRLLTSNIDESNSGIIMRVFRRCRHISVLNLLIGTCLRLLRTPTKVDLGKELLAEVLKIAVKAEKDSIAAFSKFCEVSFLDIRSFLAENGSRWITPTRQELTQEWEDKTSVAVDLGFLPWYMDNIIIPMTRDCANPDLRDFCIMSRFCSHEAFRSSSNIVRNPNDGTCSYIFTVDRVRTEIEAARSTYLHYIVHELPTALASDNLDTFHRGYAVATAAKEFIDNMITNDVVAIQIQCMEVYTAWIVELLPHLNLDMEIRFPMSRTQELLHLVSCGVSGLECIHFDEEMDKSPLQSALAFCEAAFKVPCLDHKMQSKLLCSTWQAQVRSSSMSSNFDHFRVPVTIWREALVHADPNASVLPHQATAFQEFLKFYFSRQDFSWDCDVPAHLCPFACSVKLLLEESRTLFISVSRSKPFTSHIQSLISDALTNFWILHSDSSLKRTIRFLEMLTALEPVVLDFLNVIIDWFLQQISSCDASNLQDAASFNSVISLFHKVLLLTKPVGTSNTSKVSAVDDLFIIQRRVHACVSQLAPRMLESYISKYYDTFTRYNDDSDLPGWFTPVKILGHMLATAVQGLQAMHFTTNFFSDIPEPKWVANTPTSLLCLRIYLRLFSRDQLCANISFVVDLIVNLCSRCVLFGHEGDAAAVYVPATHFETVFELIIYAAAKYCVCSHQTLISITEATIVSIKEIIRSINQLACDEKSSQPGKRKKFSIDFNDLFQSLQRTCSIPRLVFSLFKHTIKSATPPQVYCDALALHATNLVLVASAVVTCEDLFPKHANMCLQAVVADLPYFLKQSTGPNKVVHDTVYGEAASSREYHRLLFSIISVPDTKFDTFQEEFFLVRIRMQDSLMNQNSLGNGEKLLIRLQRLEYIVRTSQIMIESHFGGSDPMKEPVKLPGILSTLPKVFLNQFHTAWCEMWVSYDEFMKKKHALSKRKLEAHEIQAQCRDHFADFFASFQVGSVQTWFENVTGNTLPVQLLSLSNDARLRPVVLSHFCRYLLMSLTNVANGPLPTQLLTLCAPIAALGSADDVIELLRTAYRHHRNTKPLAHKSGSIPILIGFFEIVDTFQGLLESCGFCHASNVVFNSRLLICADFVTASNDPVFIAALRIIIRSQSAPPLPLHLRAAVSETPANLSAPQHSLTAKQQSQEIAHLFGSLLIPLIKQANLSGSTFNNSLGMLFSVIHSAVTRK